MSVREVKNIITIFVVVVLKSFKETKYNFGKIKQGQPVTHDFVFTNISGTVVIIENAQAAQQRC